MKYESRHPGSQIGTARTRQFHERLATALPEARAQFRASLHAANQSMHERHMEMSQNKQLQVALSALLLTADDVSVLRRLTETLCSAVERTLEYLVGSPELLEKYFPEFRRIFPYLTKTRGSQLWQALARYDVVVTPDGDLKVMELNTACPGAFFISQAVSQVTRHGLQNVRQNTIDLDATQCACVSPNHVCDALLDIERQAGIDRGAIGILNDENQLIFELEHMVEAFRARDRDAMIVNARDLLHQDGQLFAGDKYLSLAYGKFRISTPQSPNHCWTDGFEQRYASYLAAQQAGDVVAINNLVAMTIAENKALLGVLREPEIMTLLDDDQREVIDNHVLWTARLAEGHVEFEGQGIDLLPYLRENRERFVIKPANEGRGYGVVIGKFCTDAQWQSACEPDPRMPKVVQQFSDALTFPVVCERQGEAAVEQMFLTLGLAAIRGRFEGVVSRISANPVTNVAREGFGQAVFVVN